ncbi:hypothetical protein D3C87_1655690 [compost metagenome]
MGTVVRIVEKADHLFGHGAPAVVAAIGRHDEHIGFLDLKRPVGCADGDADGAQAELTDEAMGVFRAGGKIDDQAHRAAPLFRRGR